MILRKIIFFLLGVVLLLLPITPVLADLDESTRPADDYFFRARIISVETQPNDPLSIYTAEIISGSNTGEAIEVFQESIQGIQIHTDVSVGDNIIVLKSSLSPFPYELYDVYRTNQLWLVFVIFAAIVIGVTGKKGARSVLGLALTLTTVAVIILPLLTGTQLPTIVSISVGALIILAISLYICHGWNKRTHTAFIASLLSLLAAIIIGYILMNLLGLLGIGADEAVFLKLGNLDHINLRGLLLGAMILGAVGVLDDVTIIQSTTVSELQKANPSLSSLELYKRALVVGHEHIVSMVNTLFIAYTGAALPLLLFYTMQSNVATPLWVVLNSNAVVEEILRSIVGSIAIVLSVPLSSALAAYMYTKHYDKKD